MTYLFYADLREQKSAFPEDNIELPMSGDLQSLALSAFCKEGNPEGVLVIVSLLLHRVLYKTLGIKFLQH